MKEIFPGRRVIARNTFDGESLHALCEFRCKLTTTTTEPTTTVVTTTEIPNTPKYHDKLINNRIFSICNHFSSILFIQGISN